jgi:hypothetical protein
MRSPANVNLIFDNAHADGLMTKWGFGRDWAATEPGLALSGWDPAMVEPTAWYYNADLTYIPPLNCIAPAPRISRSNNGLGDAVIESGLWRVTGTAGYLRTTWMHYYDGNPNRIAAQAYGSLYLNHTYPTNISLWVWRMAGSALDSDPPLVIVWLLGDGECPILALMLPGFTNGDGMAGSMLGRYGGAFDRPLLCACPVDSNAWIILAQAEDAGSSQTIGEHSQLQQVIWEYLDGCALIRLGDVTKYWCYGGDWVDAEGRTHTFEQRPGPIRIQVCGHPAMFNIAEISYPLESLLLPRQIAYLGPLFAANPQYRAIQGSNNQPEASPAPAGLTVMEDGTCPPSTSRPMVTFTTSDKSYRACLYAVQQYNAPEFAYGDSNPIQTEKTSQLVVMEAQISLSARWRGATLQAQMEAAPGETLGFIKTNSKVQANLSLNNGETWFTKFCGYVLPQEPNLDGSYDQIRSELRAADGIEARLTKKTMFQHCSYEQWPLGEAFSHILMRSGVPAALIYVDPAIDGPDYILPSARRKGQRQFQFGSEETPIAALDSLTGALNCEWGYGVDGRYFVRPQLKWDGVTVDFVLEEQPEDTADFLLSFRAAQSVEEYINVLVAMTDCGSDSMARMLLDAAAWQDPLSEHFIGDDWWHLEIMREKRNLDTVADLLWHQRHRLERMIWFELHGHPELLPDMFVECRIPGCDVPEGTVFRITRDDCRIDGEGELTDSFEAEVVGQIVEGS